VISTSLIVAVHLAVLYVRRSVYTGIHPFVLMDVFMLVLFGLGPLFDPALMYNIDGNPLWSWYVNIGLIALYAGLHLPELKQADRGCDRAKEEGHVSRRTYAGCIAFLLIWAYEVSHKLLVEGQSIAELALGGKSNGYLTRDILSGERVIVEARLFCGAAVNVLLWNLIVRRRFKSAALVFGIVSLSVLTTSANRTPFLLLGGTLLLGYLDLKKRSLKPLTLAALLPALVLPIWFLNNVRSHGLSGAFSFAINSEAVSQMVGNDLSTVRGLDWLLAQEHAGILDYENGLNYYYTFLTFVPRYLWPEKPLTSFENRWTEIKARRQMGSAVAVETFTAWGTGVAQFGLSGVVVELLGYGLIVSVVNRWLGRQRGAHLVRFAFSVTAALYLRGGIQSLLVYSVGVILSVGLFRLCEPRLNRPESCLLVAKGAMCPSA
jgi:hypothetical protein